MAKLLKLRRGSTTQHASFTGAEGEVTIDTTKDTAVIHDGAQAGGRPLLREDMDNLPAGTIDNADINASAAIAGTKINPNFGGQNVSTTGSVDSAGMTISAVTPTINFNDSNDDPDFRLLVNSNSFILEDTTNSANRFVVNSDGHVDITGNLDAESGIDVTGNITGTANVDIDGQIEVGSVGTFLKDNQLRSNASGYMYFDHGTQNQDIHFRTSNSGPLDTTGMIIKANGNVDFANGIDVTGNNNTTGNVTTTGHFDVATHGELTFKSGATNAVVNNLTGYVLQNSLHLRADQDIWLSSTSGKKITFGTSDGATHEVMRVQCAAVGASQHGYVNLNYVTANAGGNASSATKLSTTNGGIDVTGGINLTSNLSLLDNSEIKVGTNDDLKIYYNGTHSFIDEVQSGNLALRTNPNGTYSTIVLQAGRENSVICNKLGSVELYHIGGVGSTSKKLETTSTGVDITGVANATHFYTTGNIGRDSNDNITFTDDTQMDITIAGNNEFRFEADGDFHADGDVIAFSTTTASDEKLKENIEIVSDPIEKVEALRGVTFDWKRDGTSSAGVIAQDVMKVLPEAVKEVQGLNDNESHLAVNYHALTSILIESVKELSARVKELEAK